MLTVTSYIEFLSPTAQPLPIPQRYQPYFPGETRTFEGLTYQFSPFSIAGDISTDGNETGDYELIAPANIISSGKLGQAAEDRQFIKVQTVLLTATPPLNENDYPRWRELNFLTSTICVCDSFGYTDKAPSEDEGEDNFALVTLRLASPLNFVAGTAPTRRLTAAQVGPLPASGGIVF
jgi:hypothetical protein